MEILFEMTTIGSVIRVAAIDAETGTEAVIQGPTTYSPELLKRNAAKKLRYVIEKNRESEAK